jgi:asparagine synthase (glutamine-hydrolysing)
MPDRAFSYSLRSSVPAIELFTFDFLSEAGGCDPLQLARDHFNAAPARDELNRWLYMDLKITISENDIRKVSTMSQLAGVTPRYPFLDPELAEFTGTIPSHLKVKGSRLRYLFKKAMADVLPRKIIQKKKHGFGLPFSVWLGQKRTLRDFTFDVLGSARCRQRGYFRSDLLEWLWPQYESVHRRYYGELLWLFLMLELWHLEHYDSNYSAVTEKAARRTAGESAG